MGSALLLPVAMASPAFALNSRLAITVDCDLGETGEDNHVISPTDVLTITVLNCEDVEAKDYDNNAQAVLDGVTTLTSTAVVLTQATHEVVVTGSQDYMIANLAFGDIDVDLYKASTAWTPSSTLLATRALTLELGAPDTMIRENAIDTPGDDGEGDIYLGGVQNCDLEPGQHVYSTLEFEILTSGEYEFVATDVSPTDEDIIWGEQQYPSSDPFLALYREFDPANPESGVVMCNDDGDESANSNVNDSWYDSEEGETYRGLELYNGNIIDNQFPWMSVALEAGRYTLVYLPFSAMSSVDFSAGHYADHPNSETTWSPIAQSVTYDMWGPSGGISFEPQLAKTGVNSALGVWVGLGLLVVGATLAFTRRNNRNAHLKTQN